MNCEPDIDLFKIRAHQGRQDRAWEELVFQLWADKVGDTAEVRKTKAPDAGVEWYSLYEDGHSEGFQAKFYANLQSALSGMKESVSAVVKNRPKLTRLTFLVPFDFTDTGTSSRKSDQERWENAVLQWKNLATKNQREIEFAIIRGGEIKQELVREKHTGHRQYWFGDLGFSDAWFESKLADAKAEAHDRYTPDADVPTEVDIMLDAATGHPSFAAELLRLVHDLMVQVDTLPRIVKELEGWQAAIIALQDFLNCEVKNIGTWNPFTPVRPESWLRRLKEIVALFQRHIDSLSQLGGEFSETLGELQFLEKSLTALANRLQDGLVEVYSDGVLAIYGPSGQGKTHALLNMVERNQSNGGRALLVFGSWIGEGYWWSQVAERLGIPNVTLDNFLQILDSLGGATGRRAVIALDALNESKAPFDWPEYLRVLVSKVKQYENISLIFSLRSEYRAELLSNVDIKQEFHPGFEGTVDEAFGKYRRKFNIQQPLPRLESRSFENPLFLRLYCDVLAGGDRSLTQQPTQMEVFQEYLRVRVREVQKKLAISPSRSVVEEALQLVAQLILEKGELENDRGQLEKQIDDLLPSRTEYPRTLFQQMVECGILEVRPTYGNREAVGILFQAVSDYVLSQKVVDDLFEETKNFRIALLKHKRLWPTIAVVLAEQKSAELSDFVEAGDAPRWFHGSLASSLRIRHVSAVRISALKILSKGLENRDWASEYALSLCALAAIPDHPANSSFLTQRYMSYKMCERDAEWGVGSYSLDDSPEFRHLLRQFSNDCSARNFERLLLASQMLTWLLGSPNRYLRDISSKALAGVWAQFPAVNLKILEIFSECDDPYIIERILTCSYGALLQGASSLRAQQSEVVRFISDHFRGAAEFDVLARDSIRGIFAWARKQLGLTDDELPGYGGVFGLTLPEAPLSEEELESSYGALYKSGRVVCRRASSILFSTLPNRGDFSVKTIKGDIQQFQHFDDGHRRLRLIDETPSEKKLSADNLYEFSCRWVAQRAISLGWTEERFEEFETTFVFSNGRTSHKRERFGKKYQWIAYRELLARLCDNLYLDISGSGGEWQVSEGAWDFFLRDLDPSLPISCKRDDEWVCLLGNTKSNSEIQLEIRKPALGKRTSEQDWIKDGKDLPPKEDILRPELAGKRGVALRLDASWERRSSEYSIREMTFFRRQYLLQGSWLVTEGKGADLAEYLQFRGLMNRPLEFSQTLFQTYLGESECVGYGPQNHTEGEHLSVTDVRSDRRISYWPSSQSYLWEGNSFDCSLDRNVRIETPVQPLLGDATWVPNTAQWEADGKIIAEYRDYSLGEQDIQVLVCDEGWLSKRLRHLQMDLVVACLAEREAKNPDASEFRSILSNEFIYTGIFSGDNDPILVGPNFVNVDQREAAIKKHFMREREGMPGIDEAWRYLQELLAEE